MSKQEWSLNNKHTLRDLYGSFLEETGVTEQQMIDGNCVSYAEFVDFMYGETIHAKG